MRNRWASRGAYGQGVCAYGLRFGLASKNHRVACPTASWPHASFHLAQTAAWRHRQCPGPQPTPQPKTGLNLSFTVHCWVQSCWSCRNAGGPGPCERDALSQLGNVLVGGCAILRDPWPPRHITEPSGPYSGDPGHPGRGLLAWTHHPTLTSFIGSAHAGVWFLPVHQSAQGRAARSHSCFPELLTTS